MQDIVTMLGNGFFPIVMCGYLLYRQETKMDKLTDAINTLSSLVNKLTDEDKK
jgi:hypothetical protein